MHEQVDYAMSTSVSSTSAHILRNSSKMLILVQNSNEHSLLIFFLDRLITIQSSSLKIVKCKQCIFNSILCYAIEGIKFNNKFKAKLNKQNMYFFFLVARPD